MPYFIISIYSKSREGRFVLSHGKMSGFSDAGQRVKLQHDAMALKSDDFTNGQQAFWAKNTTAILTCLSAHPELCTIHLLAVQTSHRDACMAQVNTAGGGGDSV